MIKEADDCAPRDRRTKSRRKFLAALAVGAGGLTPLAAGWRRDNAQPIGPVPPAQLGGGRTPLGAGDFKYVGHYDVYLNGQDTTYGQGLTHRYVDGDLRFLMLEFSRNGMWLGEFSLQGMSMGGTIETLSSPRWAEPGGLRDFTGLWWDEQRSLLWTTSSIDYTTEVQPVQIFSRSLNPDGAIGDLRGPIGLQGINAKRVYGGMQRVPEWFQKEYAVGPYVVGWGGYTSLVAQGGGASMGPVMYAIPDPAGYEPGREIPSRAFKVVMDHASGDRGARVTIPVNYFDGGDPRPNPDSRPVAPPNRRADWLSPADDGLGRFVWGDSYYNTGVWIDGPKRHGFIAIASLCGGSCWYQSSTLVFDRRVFELHVFDPAHLGASVRGRRRPSDIKPSTMTELDLPGLGKAWDGNTPRGNVAGATYDARTRRLYLVGRGVNTYNARLYVFDVDA